MGYFNSLKRIKYDDSLIKVIQKEANYLNSDNGDIIKPNKIMQVKNFFFKGNNPIITPTDMDGLLNYNNSNIEPNNDNDIPSQPSSGNNIPPSSPYPYKGGPIDLEKAARVARARLIIRTLSLTIGKLIIGAFIDRFVSNKVNSFAVKTIRNSENNKKLFDFIEKEIQKVYKKHPDYKICTLEQFKNTSIYNYLCSEWIDKNKNEKLKLLGKHIIDAAITSATGAAIPLPGSQVLAIPIKGAIQYLGFNIGTSITEIVLNIGKHCLSVGINLRPIGYVLNNLMLYSFNKEGKLVASMIKEPPEELYKIDSKQAEKIFNKYKNTELLERDIKLFNDCKGSDKDDR